MCNVIVQSTVVLSADRTRKTITVVYDGPGGMWEETWTEIVFAGCAKQESLGYWKRQGMTTVTLPALQYGERNKRTGQQGFGLVPEQMGIKAIVLNQEPGKDYRLLKVVTCDGGEEAERLFGNNRVPLFVSLKDGKPPDQQPPLILAEAAPLPKRPAQGDLFST